MKKRIMKGDCLLFLASPLKDVAQNAVLDASKTLDSLNPTGKKLLVD